MHGSTPARLLLNGERAQATSVPLSLSVTSADVFSAEHYLGDAEKPEGREARSSAVFPCRLAGDKCPRRYSLMHINLGLAFPAHLCSMFHRLRKQLVSRHELVPELVYSKCLGRLQRDGGTAGQCGGWPGSSRLGI